MALPAFADTVRIAVKTQDGVPAIEAVVELVPPAGATLPPSSVAEKAEIDQRNLTFLPLVTLIRRGGRVVFANSDTTMHQVYSFAAIKQFQFEIHQGERSQPVIFDQAGVAAIGCNIHDQMIAYVYVAASPFAAITDASGTVRFADVPAGAYQVSIWHPRLPPGETLPTHSLAVGSAPMTTASYSLPPLLAPAKSRMHMGTY
ncbi:MAG TPA: hypothetical protein VG867_06715 [Rhizomicrobium sp.]|nr:hypothetical protein [Rhizomicrobium sp.]